MSHLFLPTEYKGSRTGSGGSGASCGLHVVYDLLKIVELVVPKGSQGLPNLVDTKQISESWMCKRVIGLATIDEVIERLNGRV